MNNSLNDTAILDAAKIMAERAEQEHISIVSIPRSHLKRLVDLAAAGSSPRLAKDHVGMRTNLISTLTQVIATLEVLDHTEKASGVPIKAQNSGYLAQSLRELITNLKELGDKFYEHPDIADEFLQLYCLGRTQRNRLTEQESAA